MRHLAARILTAVLCLAILMQPFWDRLTPGAIHEGGASVSLAQSGSQSIFMPVIGRGSVAGRVGAPEFAINSPADGSTVAGSFYFEAQPADPAAVSSVRFQAGSTDLGTDYSPRDGFKVYLKAADYPAGALRLTAIANGPGGPAVTKAVTVQIQPAPPPTTTIQPEAPGSSETTGTTVGTPSGNTVTILPDAAPPGTSVSIVDKSKEEIKAQTGVDYDALGVTFLGGVDVAASNPFSRPLAVNTSGFGQRVKPGEAVVTFQIMPDADGDGVAELVAANSASVAPDGTTVVADPIPSLVAQTGQTQSAVGASGMRALADGLSGPPGTIITVNGSGFNVGAVGANVGVFKSLVDGREIVLPGVFSDFGTSGTTSGRASGVVQMSIPLRMVVNFKFVIPNLPPGPATVRLRNEQTGSMTEPINITVQAAPAVTRPAAEIIDDYLGRLITSVTRLDPGTNVDSANFKTRLLAKLNDSRAGIQTIKSDTDPRVQQALTDIAVVIVGSGILNRTTADGVSTRDLTQQEKDAIDDMMLVLGFAGAVFAAIAVVSTAPFWAPFAAGWAIGVALWGLYSVAERRLNPCNPSLISQIGLSGAGSAPPSGGVGCGSAAAGGGGGRSSSAGVGALAGPNLEGRIVVSIFSEETRTRRLGPFSGVTDKTGYFFAPLIPEGEPFAAVAVDKLTGQIRTYRSVGPPVGNSVTMFFDFTTQGLGGTPFNLGDVVSATVRPGDEPKAYSFAGTTGQVLGGRYGWTSNGAAYPALTFSILDSNGDQKATFNSRSAAASGSAEMPEFRVSANGPHTVLVSDSITDTGSYTFTLGVLTATVDAPASVASGADFEVAWTGPAGRSDHVGLFRAGETTNFRYVSYAYVSSGNPVRLRAPDLPVTATAQAYEVRYLTGGSSFSIGTDTLTVTPVSATVDAPPSVASGADFEVRWTGPANRGDFLALYPAGETNNYRYVGYAYVSSGNPVRLRAPDLPLTATAQTYEVRYVSAQDYLTWGSDRLTISPVSATVDAPASVGAGESFQVSWTGPANRGDFLALYPAGERNNYRYTNYAYVSSGNPVRLRAPDLPVTATTQAYEVRYVSGQDYLTWGSDSVSVTPVSATVTAASSVNSGADFEVSWTGPARGGDFIALYADGETNNYRYLNYAYVSSGNPVRLRAPDLPVAATARVYQIRYVSGQGYLTWGERSITVNPVNATVDAPASAAAGATFDVAWTGPNNRGDYIAIYAAGQTNNSRYLAFVYTSAGNPARLRAPTQAGNYEVRYVSGQADYTWAQDTMTVN